MKNKRAAQRDPLLQRFDLQFYSRGLRTLAGVDEAGRGCLAGPVFAAAVIFPPDLTINGIRDSKLLNPKARSRFFEEIISKAHDWSVASVSSLEVDELNIHHASLKAMRLAVEGLRSSPDLVLVDGRHKIPLSLSQRVVIGGDNKSQAIAAASILAKVSRDEWMTKKSDEFPQFHFEKHKGYGTEEHLLAIQNYGLSPIHRRSFSVSLFGTLAPKQARLPSGPTGASPPFRVPRGGSDRGRTSS